MPSDPRSRDVLPPWGGGPWAIGFVVVALVALAAVPMALGRRAADSQRLIVEVLDPARSLAAELSLIHAQQHTRYQAFLLTGDLAYREPFRRSVAREREIYERLSGLASEMDLDVRERLAAFSSRAARWNVARQDVLNAGDPLPRQEEHLEAEETEYEALRRDAVELERAIESEVDAGRRRMERIRRLQARISVALALLALGATAVVVMVGRHLRGLTAEAERRRRDAVQARREIDALLEATGDGVIGVDLDGTCLSMNRAGSELLGYTETEIRGRDLHETIHHSFPDGTPRSRDASPILQALVRGERADCEDDVFWRRRRIPFPVRWSLRPLMDGRELRGGVVTFTDMTTIREQEEALRKAVRTRDEVVSIVSHDLRNPLGVVAAAADLLLDLPLDEEERRRQVEIIARSAARMSRLIEDLLDVSRIEAGALVVRTAQEDPEEILEEVRSEFEDQAADRGLRLVVAVERGTPPARADRDRVLQALSNLIGNALKFTPSGGTIRVTAEPAGDGVAFSVEDDGPGIPEEAQAHLFDRFWQAERHGRTGAGLGLAIVRGIAEAHGGRVEVSSREGQGARFTLVLPSAEGSPKEAQG